MSQTYLDQLAAMTVIVADTGDIQSIERHRPRDATTNPSLLAAAAKMPDYQGIVDDVLRRTRVEGDAGPKMIGQAVDGLAVAFGVRILEIVPGRVSTEVDARLSFDTRGTIEKALQLIQRYADAGVPRERVLIKIASTWEGIRAAEQLERQGIHCNLTLLFGLHQAVACAEAGVTLVSPFVGRILDWHKKATGRTSYPPTEDPGVQSVTAIYNYFKKFGFRTEVMGASFRNLEEIVELAGCDLLTIAPDFLQALRETRGHLARKLSPERSAALPIERIAMDHATFQSMHAQDPMASDKLAEGIDGFARSGAALEAMLTERLLALDGREPLHRSV